MKTKFNNLSLAILLAVLFAGSAYADTTKKMTIKLKTDDFEIAETDISNLQVGAAETIVTDSGKIIDLLRTANGVEIYVDGEMLEMPEMSADVLHEGDNDTLHQQIHVKCMVKEEAGNGEVDSAMECATDKMGFSWEGDLNFEPLHEAGDAQRIIIIEKEVVTDDDL